MTYRDRREAKAERLREWAGKREVKAAGAFDAAHQMASAIPFGQPILVGHHSENRDRRYRDRIGKACGRVFSVEDAETPAVQLSRVCECDDWPHLVILERVVGKVTKARCNADCMSARGPLCSCACGGRNHGKGWS